MTTNTGKSNRQPGLSEKAGTSGKAVSLLLGLLGTVGVMVWHFSEGDQLAEWRTLDQRFRYCTQSHPPEPIVHVDIDDTSLEELGRWPWPRGQLAGVIDALSECGATTIALDLILPDPQKVRYVSEADELYDASGTPLVAAAPPLPTYDDIQLATILRQWDNVHVPMHIDLQPLHAAPPRADTPEKALHRAMGALLREKPTLSLHQAREALGCDPYASPLAGRDDLWEKAYLRARGIAALETTLTPKALGNLSLRAGVLTPPLVLLAQAAKQSGFVTVMPDDDGVVRRIPLLGRDETNVYPQFALALALDELSHKHGAVSVEADDETITLHCQDGTTREIPLDAEGNLQIHWDTKSIPHISIRQPAWIAKHRQALARNHRLSRQCYAQLATLLQQEELLTLFQQADVLCKKRLAAERAHYAALLYTPATVPNDHLALREKEAALEKQIEEKILTFRDAIDSFYLKKRPADPTSQALYDRCVLLRERIDEIPLANAKKQAAITRLLRDLRKIVAGKICLIGSTSTGAADFVPTPLHKRTPGVAVHGAILNTILSGRFLTPASPWVNALAILLLGGIVTYLSATQAGLRALVITLLLAAAYVAFNAGVVFRVWNVWLTMIAPLAAMLTSFLLITTFRQLTEEREKRKIRGLFAHALSPALVDKLLDDPSIAKLGGQRRELTFLFSDLAGFTAMSERIGPQNMVALLNRYFDGVTDVVQNRRGGYLNKFLGDGLFVFFGAPVFQEDHAQRAILASLECQDDLQRLNRELTEETGVESELGVRIGVSTGEAVVGNCGSSERMDYTAIGDPVNLAARLQSACKFFGIHTLVTDETWQEGKVDLVAARPLGKVYIRGLQGVTTLWDIVGWAEKCTPATREKIEAFTQALHAIDARNFAKARETLQALLAAHDDKPAELYLDLCERYLAGEYPLDTPPALEDPNGIVRLCWD